AADHALQLKTLNDAIKLRNTLINHVQRATQATGPERKRLLCTVIVGGGWTGVEAAGQIADLQRTAFSKVFQSVRRDEYCIKIVERGDRLLHFLDPRSSARAQKRLEQLGVEVVLNATVKRVTKDGIDFDSKHLDCGLVLWTSGVISVASKFFDAKLLNDKKRIVIEPTLAIAGHEGVFAVGDCADVVTNGHGPSIPQTAQAATQGAPILARNILAALTGGQMEVFRFKKRGELVPIGDWYAVAELGSFRFSGKFAWWLRRTVFLFSVFSWLDRIKIVIDWTLNIFMKRDTSEIH
ncbi:MAG: FAD-dependent oxidoreductase, partial [bacterium]|nr:FAD-dependent oxidoreductase [bacterium]